MRNLKFKYAKAENFLCFGEEGIELNFEQYGNIVCVKGENLDVSNDDGTIASNGSGKSSLPEIIVYALYGKTIKKPKKLAHTDIVNNKSENVLRVELLWDDYRLVRTRDKENKGILRLWQSDKGEWDKKSEISAGAGLLATQKKVEEAVGLTYESFINIFIFSDDNTLPFLECENPTKREIVENLLSLDRYRNYSKTAKESLKLITDKVKELMKEYELFCIQKDAATTRISQVEKQEKDWIEARKKELDKLLLEIKTKRDDLEKSKAGSALAAYQEAQEQIVELKQRIPELEEKKTQLDTMLGEYTSKSTLVAEKLAESNKELVEVNKLYEASKKIVDDNSKIIEEYESKTGKECPYCYSFVEEQNFANIINKAKELLETEKPIFDELQTKHSTTQTNNNTLQEFKKKLDKGILEIKAKAAKANADISNIYCSVSELSKIDKPDSGVAELLLCDQIESLKKQAVEKQEQMKGATPFEDIKQTAFADLTQKVKECTDKKEEIKKLEAEVPYNEFWVKAFGDSGIRKYIIDGIIPTLNERIEYWLQFLIDNKIKLTFDNELNETIDRFPFNGRPYVYHGMSGGQRRRLNLTVAAAWAFISALNSGASPSAIFLDEVTMNMDVIGIQGIYRMICELAKEKQVFVIDHNETLLQMLNGCDVISLEMNDEVSKKV